MNILVKLGPYDFHDVENTGIVEFSHENRIQCGMWNVTEFGQI